MSESESESERERERAYGKGLLLIVMCTCIAVNRELHYKLEAICLAIRRLPEICPWPCFLFVSKQVPVFSIPVSGILPLCTCPSNCFQ